MVRKMRMIRKKEVTPMLAIVEPARTDTSDIPTLREISPKYAALCDRRDKLQEERGTVAALVDRYVNDLYSLLRGSGKISSDAAHADRIAAIAAGNVSATAGATQAETASELRDRQSKARQQLEDIDAALLLLQDQIMRERFAASALIREIIRPRHEHLVAVMCGAMTTLHEAVTEYDKFAATCNGEQIAWSSLEPMFARFIGGVRRNDSKIAEYLRSAAKHGFISESEIPAELR